MAASHAPKPTSYPHEITPAQLIRLIGTPDCPRIIDICTAEDFAADPHLVPGAIRLPHDDMPRLVAAARGQRCVVVCQKGRKLSQGVSAWLRSDGIAAEHLAGGMYGWRDHPGAPRLPVAALPPDFRPGTLWVTRARPKVDRIACAWLIRRFVDAAARFLFVAPAEVPDVADRFGAVPFDIPGVRLTHRGTGVTFDAMLADFGLAMPALDRMADVIRAADTGRLDAAPQAAGLLALSLGLSRLQREDTAQLNAGLPLYDMLYRWARDAHLETHHSFAGDAA